MSHFCFSEAKTFTISGDKRIGRKYKKVVYREYNSAQFKVQKKRTAAEKHLGVLGPMLHAEVGDTIKVVFKNMATGRFSMHPHGLYYRYKTKLFTFEIFRTITTTTITTATTTAAATTSTANYEHNSKADTT